MLINKDFQTWKSVLINMDASQSEAILKVLVN